MERGVRPRSTVLAAVLLAGGAWLASPAGAASVTLGLQSGTYSPRQTIEGRRFDDASWFVSSVVDLQVDRLGFSAKYVFSPYELDFGLLSQEVAAIDVNRHDLDLGIRYRLDLGDAGISLTPFVGFRSERQSADLVVVQGPSVDISFDVLAIPVGATGSYAFRRVDLSAFVVATVFPWARVEGVGDASFSSEGFGGFAVEAGLSYSLAPETDVPVSFTGSYRYQTIDPEEFDEEVQQLLFGAYYHFLDVW